MSLLQLDVVKQIRCTGKKFTLEYMFFFLVVFLIPTRPSSLRPYISGSGNHSGEMAHPRGLWITRTIVVKLSET